MKVIDLHCDTLSALRDRVCRGEPAGFAGNSLRVDLQKLKKGDYLLQCFAAYIDLKDPQFPLVSALEQVDIFQQVMKEFPDDIAQITSWKELEANQKAGRISAILTVEEGGCCMGSLSVLRVLYSLGVRIMTLTWNYENDLAFPNHVPRSVTDMYPYAANEKDGLKEKGLAFVEEMERLGILIDVSHLSDAGFWDVYHHTKKPFIASHSNARAMCPHVRNLTDEMIRAIADRGGLTGINYCPGFLDPSEHPRSTVRRMAEHAAYIRDVGGIDCMGLGSDFDGFKGDLEMYDASCLPMLEAELRRQHFTEDEIEKIFFRNALRVLKDVL